MKTYEKEIKELESKNLKIGIGYTFKRKHGNKGRVKVVSYDNDYVKIEDGDSWHMVKVSDFNGDNFEKDHK